MNKLLFVGTHLAWIFCSSTAESAMKRSQSADDMFELVQTLENVPVFNYTNEEFNSCWRAGKKARELTYEGKRGESYELYKKSVCGMGESEYSRVFTKFVEERLDAFCSSDVINKAWIDKFQETFEKIRRLYFAPFLEGVLISGQNLLYQANLTIDEIKKLEKQTIFWFLVCDLQEPEEYDMFYDEMMELLAKYSK